MRNLKTRIVIILIINVLFVNSNAMSQAFNDFLIGLPEIDCPISFNKQGQQVYPKIILPSEIFISPEFNISEQRAFAQVKLDENFPLILIGELSNQEDYFSYIFAYSFDENGNYISKKLLSHDLYGEGSEYSINPDGDIRIASYGSGDAVINTYVYENGQFIREGEREFVDSDNLPEY